MKLGDILKLRRERAHGKEQLLSVTRTRGVISQEDVGRRDSSSDDKSTYWKVHPGDIVYNTMRMWQGVSGHSNLHGIVSPAYTVCRVVDDADPRFVASLLKHPASIQEFYRYSQGLVSDTWNLRYSSFAQIEARIPELAEQQRIAEIIDALDVQISAAERFTGKLKQIEWALQSEHIGNAIKAASSGSGGWRWSTVRETGTVQLGRQRSPEHETGRFMAPYLRVANVFDGYIDYSDMLTMNFAPYERQVYNIRPGDILLNEGQSIELVGRCAIYDGLGDIYFQNTLIRYRPDQLIPEFARAIFKYWLETGEFIKIAKQTTSVAHLGASRFAAMQIPVASMDEQLRIVSMLSAVSQQITDGMAGVRKLRLIKQGLMDDLLTGRVRVPV